MKELWMPQAVNTASLVVIGDTSGLLPKAVVAITLALVCYTIGVFAERRAGRLQVWHAALFWCGLVFDTLGTLAMPVLAAAGGDVTGWSLHGITGAAAIVLMCVHAVWATVVLIRHDDARSQRFHRFSIVVWAVWLVPYALGMVIGML